MDPIILALLGTALVIGSVLVTGPFLSVLERRASELDSEILEDDAQLSGAHEAVQRSYQHYLPADIKLLILKTSDSMSEHPQELMEVAKKFLQGILERYVAATGEGPSQDRFKEIEAIALRAGKGEANAWNELSEISASLMSDWAERHRQIVERRDERKRQVKQINRRTSFWRNVAVSLQVMGLIMVLLKDVAQIQQP
jgi:hypothetical protein